MLAPVRVIAGRIILLRMGAPAFLARLGCDDCGQRIRHQVGQFKRFHQIAVPDEATVRDTDIIHTFGDLFHFRHPLGQCPVRAEDGGIGLHRLLHGQTQLCRGRAAIGMAQSVKARHRLVYRRAVHLRNGFGAVHDLPGTNCRRTTKDHKVDQAV